MQTSLREKRPFASLSTSQLIQAQKETTKRLNSLTLRNSEEEQKYLKRELSQINKEKKFRKKF